MDWTTIVAAAVSAGGGALLSPLVPWVQWSIEKRRQSIQYKRDLIAGARNALEEAMEKGDYNQLLNSSAYHAVRPYLSQKAVGMLEAKFVGFQDGDRVGAVNGVLIDAIAQLEREWGLISGEPGPRMPSRVPVQPGRPHPWEQDGQKSD